MIVGSHNVLTKFRLIRLLPIWPHRATLYQPELPFQIVTPNLLKK